MESTEPNPQFVPMNWKELALLVERLREPLKGLFVERVVVPARPHFPEGFVRGEWSIRLTGRRQEISLLFSVRPRNPYLYIAGGAKGPRNAERATHSPFSLSLSRQLRGAKCLEIEALERERIVILWFSAPDQSEESRFGLILSMIPSAPEALLVSRASPKAPAPWPIIARTRMKKAESAYELPAKGNPPDSPPLRPEISESRGLEPLIDRALAHEAFALRLSAAQKALKERLKQARERLRQSRTAESEARNEKDWQKFGDLLKFSLSDAVEPTIVEGHREVLNYASGERVRVPCDVKLSLKEQIERYFNLARRKQRRIDESHSRAETFAETHRRAEESLAVTPGPLDWAALENLEEAAGIERADAQPLQSGKRNGKRTGAWLGKSFKSKDGMTIWVGKSKDENLELTFKHARGNDLWMHLRGRPGAHVVIPLPTNKSPPLETLLDAAMLTIHYSGGSKWGKTEVDYTFKKYVKRIKDSTEASYTNNKTLLVEPDETRLKRLTSQNT